MHWKIKGVIQKTLSVVPGGEWVNDRLQRAVGGLRRFEDNVRRKVFYDWLVIMSHLQGLGVSVRGWDLVEIGAGWYPTLPVCFFLAGAGSCKTFDIARHLDAGLTFRMLRCLEEHLPAIAEKLGLPLAEIQEAYRRLRQAGTPEELLLRSRIQYFAPADAARSGLPDASVDLVYSNSVLEHVPREGIAALMRETARILRPGGLAVHSVACNDHYAHFDRRISFVNYLRYSESQWRWWNNRLNYQNRLRAVDFLELAEAAGLRVIFKQTAVRPGTREALARMKIAPEFRHYEPESLAATSIDLIAQAPERSA